MGRSNVSVSTLPAPFKVERFDPDPGRSYTLPSRLYTDPAVYAWEQQAIFARSWTYAGHLGALAEPGCYVTCNVADQNILVIRGKDGALRGFYNVCQHRAHELLKGGGRAKVITCPYHAWSYQADGALRTARGAEKLEGFDAAQFCLKTVRVEAFAGKFVFFNLDRDALPLAEQAGDLAAELAAEIVDFAALEPVALAAPSTIRCNWKVAVDNYLECYHCGPAHPAFTDLIAMDDYRTVIHGIWSTQKGGLGRPRNMAYPVGETATSRRGMFWWLWPTTVFNVLPGAPSLNVSTFMPGALDRTDRWGQNFAVPGAGVDEARAAYGRTVLGPEDVGLCESVQRGLASRGYGAGRFNHDPAGGEMTEEGVHHFHRLVAEALSL
jgi:carnitine monooxygenase subunit